MDVDNGKNIYLNKEDGISNCKQTCYYAAALHLLAPILYNAIVNTQSLNYNNIILKEPKSREPFYYTSGPKTGQIQGYKPAIYEDLINTEEPFFSRKYGITFKQIINIVPNTIIPLITNGKTDYQNKYTVLLAFSNISFDPIVIDNKFVKENGKSLFTIKINNTPFSKVVQTDSAEVFNQLIKNLQMLGYCFKYSLNSLIKTSIAALSNIAEIDYEYQNEPRYGFENVIDNYSKTYNFASNVKLNVEEFELVDKSEGGGYKYIKLINKNNQLPTYLYYTIKLFDNFGQKIMSYPKSLANIFVKGQEYEVTDIVCHMGENVNVGHYVCYSIRMENGVPKWFLYDDSHAVESPPMNGEVWNNPDYVPYYYLFKKVVRGADRNKLAAQSVNLLTASPAGNSSGSSGSSDTSELDKIVNRWNSIVDKVDSEIDDFDKMIELNIIRKMNLKYFDNILPFGVANGIIYKIRIDNNEIKKVESPIKEKNINTFIIDWNNIIKNKSEDYEQLTSLNILYKIRKDYNKDDNVFARIPTINSKIKELFNVELKNGMIVKVEAASETLLNKYMNELNTIVDAIVNADYTQNRKRNSFNSVIYKINKDKLGKDLVQIDDNVFYKVKIEGNKLVKA
jgi:hypothetical protein